MEESGRCVLTLPLITEPWQEDILETRFKIMEHLQNSLIAMEKRKLKNLEHTRAWRELAQQIEQTPKEKRKSLYQQRQKMLKNAGFTEYDFIDDMTPMQKHFADHIAAQIAHRTASNVWQAFEKYLFNTGKDVHFRRRGTLDSIANKAPAMLLTILDNKLKNQCLPGINKVDKWEYRASQYDHISQTYTKKALNQRSHRLENGDILQRDLYSAFLLMNADESLQKPNQLLCEESYPRFKQLHDEELARIRTEKGEKPSSFGVA